MVPHRRLLLTGMGISLLGLLGVAPSGCALSSLWNPCHDRLPESLAQHPLITTAWEGIDATRVWDCHAHIAGNGDSGSGIQLAAEMSSMAHPLQFIQRLFYLNAGCARDAAGQVDHSYVARLRSLVDEMPTGIKLLLFAFDQAHDEAGQARPEQSALYVPNDYARFLARSDPQHFEWVASIHPYRRDALDALERAHADGARAVKWLPPAMGIDPAAARCQPFYHALARLNMPLITHGGEEKAVHGVGQPAWGNPLRLRRALDSGVRTVVAHCASMGMEQDSDNGDRPVASFALFARMMADPAHRDHLFGDLSAVTLRNRDPAVLRTLIEQEAWHPRLLNGSDYPLPGVMPLVAPERLARAGLLESSAVPVLNTLQGYNPLLFDFVLKRHLHAQGRRLPSRVFETRDFFEKSVP
ncbi:MAG: amidohydrolase [Magnetococcales bacterium]|nr:amidohydrolase [Magnetococcales bacterium]